MGNTTLGLKKPKCCNIQDMIASKQNVWVYLVQNKEHQGQIAGAQFRIIPSATQFLLPLSKFIESLA
jgi:hypothetical protein